MQERVAGLAEQLRAELAVVPAITVHDRGNTRCGIVTFSVKGHDTPNIRTRLTESEESVAKAVVRPTAAVPGWMTGTSCLPLGTPGHTIPSGPTAQCRTPPTLGPDPSSLLVRPPKQSNWSE
ncbi:MAG: hypothetical protein NVSMB43_17410 [Pseudarthrobacter sp.]